MATGFWSFYGDNGNDEKALLRREKAWTYEAVIIDLLNNRTVAHCHLGLFGSDQENEMPWPDFVAKFRELFKEEPPEWISTNPEEAFPGRALSFQSNHVENPGGSNHGAEPQRARRSQRR
jgi:hypothetical protein